MIPRRGSILDLKKLEIIKFGSEFCVSPDMIRHCLPRVRKLKQIELHWNSSLPSNSSTEWTPSFKLFKFLVQGVGITVVTIFGVMGNLTSAIVLFQPKMRISVTFLLMCLACCDTLFLLTNFLNFGLQALVFDYFIGEEEGKEFVALYIEPYWRPLNRIALTGSIYFTVAIAIDRYVAVWWPLQSRYLCTWSRARYVAAGVVLISLTYNGIGYLTFYRPEMQTELGKNNLNMSLPGSARTMNDSKEEAFSNKSITFEFALSWQYLIIMVIFPLTLLMVFNTLIYVKVQQANKKRKIMTIQEKNLQSFTLICVMVVSVFIACNSALVVAAFIMRVYNCIYEEWNPVLETIDRLLISINSSCNFIIYCAVGTRFRQQLRELLFRRGRFSLEPVVPIQSKTNQTTELSCLDKITESPKKI
ncbi:unnamed protein product [Allacma fusca]|uniref:G-protein coupled receptors family 1 profile domain-containing protein n=1 Tax=Allacma fusca TaxID=39272 RepID=A0A8J2JWS0_9HEXA|nr:unnamed protein product [Allacma fusca]